MEKQDQRSESGEAGSKIGEWRCKQDQRSESGEAGSKIGEWRSRIKDRKVENLDQQPG